MTAVRQRSTKPAQARDRLALRSQRRELLVVAGLLAAAAVVLLSMALAQYHSLAALDENGVVTPAEVVGSSLLTKASDRIRVAFATEDGRLVEAGIPVDNVNRYWDGSTVLVRYDAANPSRVRTLQDWNPAYERCFGIGGVPLLVASAFAQRAWRWPRRLLRVAAKGQPRQSMTFTGVLVPGTIPSPWGVLSSSGVPRHAFRLSARSDLPPGPVDVEVIGDVRRRGIVIVDTPDGQIWPSGKLRRPPKQTLPKDPPLVSPARPVQPDSDPPLDIRPLPPDLVERLRQPQRKPRGPLARYLALLPLTLMVTAPVVLPDVIEARRRVCVGPPAPDQTGAPDAVAVEALPALLSPIPGFTPAPEKLIYLGAFEDASVPVLLEDAGFLYGAERILEDGGNQVAVQVLQFSSERGPLRYEALRMTTWCAEKPRRVPVPQGSGVSGSVVSFEDGQNRTRFAFVRGSRDYVVNIVGVDPSVHLDVLTAVLSMAR